MFEEKMIVGKRKDCGRLELSRLYISTKFDFLAKYNSTFII